MRDLKSAIVKQFISAVLKSDIIEVTRLLTDNGKFEAQSADNSTIQLNKADYIKWLNDRLSKTIITECRYDQCNDCIKGNPVILINDGSFPRTIKDLSEKSKTGLMLEIIDTGIQHIKFCYTFTFTENQFQYECIKDRIEVLMEKGMTLDEALNRTMSNP